MLDTGSRPLINSIKGASPQPSKIFVATLQYLLSTMQTYLVRFPLGSRFISPPHVADEELDDADGTIAEYLGTSLHFNLI